MLLVAAAGSAGAAEAAPCFGAPADYVAAFDAKDGRVDGEVRYPEPRVYLEVQGWLTKRRRTPGHHSEHVHSGTCFPQGQTWARKVRRGRLDYRHMFHNVVGYKVSGVRGGFVDAGVGIKETEAQVRELNAAVRRSAGTTVAVFQSYRLNFRRAKSNGRKEMRTGLALRKSSRKALVRRWFTSTGWQSRFSFRGKRWKRPLRGCDVIISRNWVPRYEYGNGGFGCAWRASRMDDPVPGRWSVKADMANGVRKGSFHVDPDFHHHPGHHGVWSTRLRREQRVTIPASRLAPGTHRLVYLAHERRRRKITSTAVTVMPFQVG
ncbi:MAG TPA: hypothetical protein VE644_03980 [Gaiellaceae bacterium]|nr:hypothetical protein [Gaiellaceae bacterium]